MTTLAVTPLYALPLAAIFLVLWFNVTRTRAALNISIGDGGNDSLHERIRCHGNFVEWVPMLLILMIVAELVGAGAFWLHLAGGLTVLGRVAHPFGLKARQATHVMRIVGNSTNIAALLILIVLLALALPL